jgi:SAM-dependent methyltransferase
MSSHHTLKNVIDLRSETAYKQGHLKGAVNIPFEQLGDLWHELPPKSTKLTLCVEQDNQQQAEGLFFERNFIVEQCLLPHDLQGKALEQGSSHHRLWHGNPVVEDFPHLLTTEQISPVAVDIGCGSGRDSILLGLLGYRVIGVDVFDAALARLNHSANRWNLNIDTVEMDCRKHPEKLIDLLVKHQPQLIMQSRFLHRPLLDLYEEYLPTGSKIVIHTFLEGAAKFGKPKKADFLLKNDELSERFKHWLVLLDQVHHLEDGRPLSLFIAEKQSLSP